MTPKGHQIEPEIIIWRKSYYYKYSALTCYTKVRSDIGMKVHIVEMTSRGMSSIPKLLFFFSQNRIIINIVFNQLTDETIFIKIFKNECSQ